MFDLSKKHLSIFKIVILFAGLVTSGFVVYTFLIDVDYQESYHENYQTDFDNEQDIILIAVDALRDDYIDCGNYPERTPNICELRNDSTSFANSYSHASYTVPAMSSVMTGRYPWDIDMLDYEASVMPKEVETLPEALDKRGYNNYGSWEIGAVAPDYGFDRGFEEYHHSEVLGREWNKGEKPLWLLDEAEHDNNPSLVYYHLFGLHQPFRTDQNCKDFSRRLRDTPWRGIYDVEREYKEDFSKEKAEECYKRGVKLTDERVGNIIDKLKENNQYERSLIIFMSDHGEGLWDSNIFVHTQWVHEEQIDIPMYIKLPKVADSVDEVGEGYVGHIDIYPTVLDYIGVREDFSELPGRSLIPVIKGEDDLDSRPIMSTSFNSRSVIAGDFKKIENVHEGAYYFEEKYEYYGNLSENRSEIQRKDIPEKYLEQFESYISSIKIGKFQQVQEDQDRHDEELIEQLEDLGYITR